MNELNYKRQLIISSFLVIFIFIAAGYYFITQSPNTDDEVEYVIGVSQANLTEPWRINMNTEIASEARKFKNVRVIFKNASENNQKQISDVDELLRFGIDLLIISPNDSTVLTPIIAEVYRKIPVIVMDREVEGYDYTLHIGPDNRLIGMDAGNYLAGLLREENVDVVEIQGPKRSPAVRERSAGFQEVLERFPNIKVTSLSIDNWRRDAAEDEMAALLNQRPRIGAVFAHSDYMAMGAYNTVKKMDTEDIKLVGIHDFAGPSNGLELVKEGVLQATFICPSGGKEAVQYALDILKGERGLPKKIITRGQRITREEYLANTNFIVKGRTFNKKIVLGVSQFGLDEKWRNAQAESIKQAAKEMGIELKFKDAGSALSMPLNQVQENQVKAIRSFIKNKVDGIVLAPVGDDGWEEVFQEAKAADVPIFLSGSRSPLPTDHSLFAFRIGSDLTEQGRRAARWIVDQSKYVHNIVELEGPPGRAPTIERKKGFHDVIAGHPDLNVIFALSGNFTKSGGKWAMKTALEKHGSEIHAVFAHNDVMALGAIEAIEEYGLTPGRDIIIISVDGDKEAFRAMLEGKLNCTIEYTPFIGPQLMQAVKGYVEGRVLPLQIIVAEDVFPMERAELEYTKRQY